MVAERYISGRGYVEYWWSKWDIALTVVLVLGFLAAVLAGIWLEDDRWGLTGMMLFFGAGVFLLVSGWRRA